MIYVFKCLSLIQLTFGSASMMKENYGCSKSVSFFLNKIVAQKSERKAGAESTPLTGIGSANKCKDNLPLQVNQQKENIFFSPADVFVKMQNRIIQDGEIVYSLCFLAS